MCKKTKLSVCCILTLVLMFTITCTSAFASDTKMVTINTTKAFTCTGPEITGNIQNIPSSTYYYDDGIYKGTLNYSKTNSVNVVLVGKNYNNLDIFQVTVSVTYSGTVTRYSSTTKSVIVTVDKTFTCIGPQVNANMQAIQNSTYYYDDGNYRGALNYSKINSANVTIVGHDYSGDILHFIVNVEYCGTVNLY